LDQPTIFHADISCLTGFANQRMRFALTPMLFTKSNGVLKGMAFGLSIASAEMRYLLLRNHQTYNLLSRRDAKLRFKSKSETATLKNCRRYWVTNKSRQPANRIAIRGVPGW
jgi:hypothetical protein